ncbi:kinase-like protein [Atractiella rhizophila]|nr:kinase-like protein [Atractiella rhizophila]
MSTQTIMSSLSSTCASECCTSQVLSTTIINDTARYRAHILDSYGVDLKEYDYISPAGEGSSSVVFRLEKTGREAVALKGAETTFHKSSQLWDHETRDDEVAREVRNLHYLRGIPGSNEYTSRFLAFLDNGSENNESLFTLGVFLEYLTETSISRDLLSFTDMQRFMRDLLRAVSFLHSNGICHNDLKWSNTGMSPSRTLKLLDFGLSSLYAPGRFFEVVPLGTLCYAAPELLFAFPFFTPAVDMWSIGCMFAQLIFRLYKGRTIFRGKRGGEEGIHDNLHSIAEYFGYSNMGRLLRSFTEEAWVRDGSEWTPGHGVEVTFFDRPPHHFLDGFSNLWEYFTYRAHGDAGDVDCAVSKWEHLLPYIVAEAWDFLNSFLQLFPDERISADDALDHAFMTVLKAHREHEQMEGKEAGAEIEEAKSKGWSDNTSSDEMAGGSWEERLQGQGETSSD